MPSVYTNDSTTCSTVTNLLIWFLFFFTSWRVEKYRTSLQLVGTWGRGRSDFSKCGIGSQDDWTSPSMTLSEGATCFLIHPKFLTFGVIHVIQLPFLCSLVQVYSRVQTSLYSHLRFQTRLDATLVSYVSRFT